MRAGGAGSEGFQTEGYGYPVGYLVYGFDELLSKLYTIPTPSAMIDISGEFILFTDIERQFHDD